jgi:hypothetical protein
MSKVDNILNKPEELIDVIWASCIKYKKQGSKKNVYLQMCTELWFSD